MEQWEIDFVAGVSELARTKMAERAAEVDRTGVLSQENVADLKAIGATSVFLPVEYGGKGQSIEGTARMLEAVAYVDGSTAVALNMHMLVADALLNSPPWPYRD